MHNGTVLISNVYGPAGGSPYPVLLARHPYGKDISSGTSMLDPIKAAKAGYIVVVQDVRERYRSGGGFVSFVGEYEDGYDTVEWAASLPGSDGSVGMHGLSYFGKTQWHAAAMRPPSLRSMAPAQTWATTSTAPRCGRRPGARPHTALGPGVDRHRPPLPQVRRGQAEDRGEASAPDLHHRRAAGRGGYEALPLKGLPHPDDLVPFVEGGFGRGVDDEAWDYVTSTAGTRPWRTTFHIGGWYDCFIGETLKQYEVMKRLADERGTRSPFLMVGPWTHGDFGSTQGDLDFGIGSSEVFLDYRGDLTDAHLRWFDATLKGEEAALEGTPPVKVFVMGENRWRGYEEWPPRGSREEDWFMISGGSLRREPGGLDDEPAGYDYDPEDPVPTVGGAVLLADIHRPGPRDQREIEARPDVLCYTGPALESPYTVLGSVYVTLFAASSAPDTDFVARLVDVHPDGRAIGVCDGILRASARESYPAPGMVRPVAPSPIEPGRVYEYVIDLWGTGITFLPGHRIRVEITSSSHPRWERNLNTGEGAFDSSRTEVAHQTIFHDAGRPSRITLTTVEG